MRVWVLCYSRLPAGSKRRTSCCLVWGWVPVMALWQPSSQPGCQDQDLGLANIVSWREEDSHLGGEDWQYKRFCFVLAFTWNSEVSRCQAAACRLEERASLKIHMKTNFVKWMDWLPPFSKHLSITSFGTLRKISGLARNHTPKFQYWVIFRTSSPHFL